MNYRIARNRLYIKTNREIQVELSGNLYEVFRESYGEVYIELPDLVEAIEMKILDSAGGFQTLLDDTRYYFLHNEYNNQYCMEKKDAQTAYFYKSRDFHESIRLDNQQAYGSLEVDKLNKPTRLTYRLDTLEKLVDYEIDENGKINFDRRYLHTPLGELFAVMAGQIWQIKKETAVDNVIEMPIHIKRLSETSNQKILMQLSDHEKLTNLFLVIGKEVLWGNITTEAIQFDLTDIIATADKVVIYGITNNVAIRSRSFNIEENTTDYFNFYGGGLYFLADEYLPLYTKVIAWDTNKEIKTDKVVIDGNQLSVKLSKPTQKAFLIFKKRKSSIFYAIHGKKEEQFLTIDMTSFFEQEAKSQLANRYDVFLHLFEEGDYTTYRLKSSTELEARKKDRFYPIFERTGISTYSQFFQLYKTVDNTFTITKNTISNLVKERFEIKTVVSSFHQNTSGASIEIDLSSKNSKDFQANDLYFVKRNKDALEYRQIPLEKRDNRNKKLKVTVKMDYKTLSIEPLFWDLYLEITIDGQSYWIRLNKTTKNVRKTVKRKPIKNQYRTKDNYLLYPYITEGNDLSFTYRASEYYESPINNWKERLAYYTARLMRGYFSKKDIWIGFEKLASSAHDSGYHFFNYCYANKKHKNFYYVITKGATEEKFLLDKKDKVLYFMTFKYFLYLFSASVLISSDTRRNVYNLRQKETPMGREISKIPLVYLQHGVNGLKKVPDFYKKRQAFDFVCVPSEFEQKMVIEDWGYEPKEVAVTGLARWDVMEDKTNEVRFKQIFVMPTWRTWMDGLTKEKFVETSYYREYQSFLASDQLKELLLANNVRIAFFLHPKFKDYIDLFDIDPAIITKYEFLEVPMDEMIMKSSMMISDYSSVIWEMYYMKKPCIFFQFDLEKYMQYEGMYMDPKQDLFGDVAFDADTLINIIEENIDNDFHEKEKYAKMRTRYFSLMDKNNAARIYDAIIHSEVIQNKQHIIKKINTRAITKNIIKKLLLQH